jgi:hypothetical protein
VGVCPSSRRVYAAAAHAKGAAAGPPLSPPVPNQASRPAPIPRTPPAAATARGAAVNTGADTATGGDTDVSDEPVGAAASSLLPTAASVGAETSDDDREGISRSGVLTSMAGASTVSARLRPGFGREGSPTPGTDESPLFCVEPVPGALEPPRDRRPDSSASAEPATSESADPDRGPRCGPRAPAGDEAPPVDADESSLELVEPVGSASAAGHDTKAEPTPSATAKAPTRPT